MIDFHSHILPGIDDGSKNEEMSLAMLAMESEQGVERIVATPHFYAGKDSVGHFITARQDSVDRLQEAAKHAGNVLPEILLGAEVYYFGGIGDASMVSSLCIEGTDILLLEMPFAQWTASMKTDIEKLIRQKKTIVLAHIERYPEFQKKWQAWNDIMELPIYKQMNAGAFLHWRTRRKNLALFEENQTVLLGSDCHNTDSRKPNLAEGRQIIAGKLGEDFLAKTDALGKELLG